MSNKVRVAIVGVGNCASSLIQGRYYYENANEDEFVPGLMHVRLGDYHVRDIEFVAAFDVNANKVGKDLGEAIYAEPNNTIRFMDVPQIGVTVQRGPTMDGIGRYVAAVVPESDAEPVDVVAALKAADVDVLVSYLPVGSEDATRWYAEQAIEAGVAFVNAIPVFIGREPEWQAKFAAGRAAHHRRRHQEPGRCHHHPPRADPPLRRPRRAGRPDLPAELRRQHRLPEHARARPPRVQEDQQDQRRHLAARLRAARGRGPRRPLGPRALAGGPQVLQHPHRGHDLRRRAPAGRAQARGVGQPQQRRRHHRRHPLRQDRSRPRVWRARSWLPRHTS